MFEYDLQPVLARHDLGGLFDKKGGTVDEGLAVFYRKSRFKLVSDDNVVLSDALDTRPVFADIWDCVRANEALADRMKKRTTALKTVVLESNDEPGRLVVVGNTHLYFKPDADHVRLLQAEMCVREVRRVKEDLGRTRPDARAAVLICGDFNSTPPCAVYQYMKAGSIASSHPEWSSCPGEEVRGLSVEHSFKLGSACGAPAFTNYTVGFKDCLDYIFYETDKMGVQQVVPFPSEEELAQHVALPNVMFPSDHVAVVGDLAFKS